MFSAIKTLNHEHTPMWLKRISKMPFLLISLIVVLLYGQSIYFDFTQDDAIVIYDNQFTTSGLDGIADILTHDSFYGFFGEDKAHLVSGGRYRPLSIVYFAVVFELFGPNPLPFHLSNLFMYILVCGLLLYFLQLINLFDENRHQQYLLLGAVIVFVVHPIHTEVVANIKGLDELWSLLFSLLTFIATLKYIDSRKVKFLVLSCGSFFLGLLYKENAINVIGLVPLTLYFFRKPTLKQWFTILLLLIATATIYLALRFSIIGMPSAVLPSELMNNPFIKVIDGVYHPYSTSEKWASIVYGLGKYIGLLFFPHPLTHDYYPSKFDIFTFYDPLIILPVIMYSIIILFAAIDLPKKKVISYVSLFYLMTIGLTANIFFPIGTHLSERFLFMPSVSYAILVGILLQFCYRANIPRIGWVVFAIIITLFSYKTITRTSVWKDNYTLFTNDVKISNNSAKAHNSAGGALITRANQIDNVKAKEVYYQQAVHHLERALGIHPRYKSAQLLLGNAHYGLLDYTRAINAYQRCLEIDPNFNGAFENMFLAYREGARHEGSHNGNIAKAISWLNHANDMNPNDFETISLLGIAYGNLGNTDDALKYFKKALSLSPNNAMTHKHLSKVYHQLQEYSKEKYHLQKAKALE